MIAAGAVKRLARGGGHHLEALEPGGARRVFAQSQNQPPDPAPDVARIGVHRADPCGLAGRIEQPVVAQFGRVIAAVKRGALAPPAAADQFAAIEDREVGPVGDQLGIEPHAQPARRDLLGIEERALQFGNRTLHQRGDRGGVGGGSEAVSQLHQPAISRAVVQVNLQPGWQLDLQLDLHWACTRSPFDRPVRAV